MSAPHYLVTGAAGFIGFHVARRLLEAGACVTGVDNLNDYYPVALKEARLAELERLPGFSFRRLGVEDRAAMEALPWERYAGVVHLAAQAGVRYSVEQPHAYTAANIEGMLNVLEGCRHARTPHLVFASSSSVYGDAAPAPFSEGHAVDHPVSLYAATKRAGELMAHTYAHLYGLPITCLRFFTVYGPWGRPDMALFRFTERMLQGLPIEVYGGDQMRRDFTYVDDVAEGVVRVLHQTPAASAAPDALAGPATSTAPFRVFNIGGGTPVLLSTFIDRLEEALGVRALRIERPRQPGDVLATHADTHALEAATGFRPRTPLRDGLQAFADWYRSAYVTLADAS